MSGSIEYEFAILTGELLLCLGAVVRFAGVDLTDGPRRWFVLAGGLAYWGIARGILAGYGSVGTFVPLLVGLVLGTVAVIAVTRLG